MDQLLTDLRYAIRTWRRNPGFVIVAIVTLALGIGANTTMFSVVNATLLRRCAFPDPDRLMTRLEGPRQGPDRHQHRVVAELPGLAERSRSFASLAMFDSAGRGYNLTGSGRARAGVGRPRDGELLRVLGVQPMLGRTFRPEEEKPGSESRGRPEPRPVDAQLRRRSLDRREGQSRSTASPIPSSA